MRRGGVLGAVGGERAGEDFGQLVGPLAADQELAPVGEDEARRVGDLLDREGVFTPRHRVDVLVAKRDGRYVVPFFVSDD